MPTKEFVYGITVHGKMPSKEYDENYGKINWNDGSKKQSEKDDKKDSK